MSDEHDHMENVQARTFSSINDDERPQLTRDEIEALYGWKPGERDAVMAEMADRQAAIDRAAALAAATASATVPADYRPCSESPEDTAWLMRQLDQAAPVTRSAAPARLARPENNPLAQAVRIALGRQR